MTIDRIVGTSAPVAVIPSPSKIRPAMLAKP